MEKKRMENKMQDEEIIDIIHREYPYTVGVGLKIIRSIVDGKPYFQITSELDDYLLDYAYEYTEKELFNLMGKQNAR